MALLFCCFPSSSVSLLRLAQKNLSLLDDSIEIVNNYNKAFFCQNETFSQKKYPRHRFSAEAIDRIMLALKQIVKD